MAYGNDTGYAQQGAIGALTPANPLGIKEANVQERMTATLVALAEAHAVMDAIESSPTPADARGGPPLGLIGGSLACAEQAQNLLQRLNQLRARLGSL